MFGEQVNPWTVGGRKVEVNGLVGHIVMRSRNRVAFRPRNAKLPDMAILPYDEVEIIE